MSEESEVGTEDKVKGVECRFAIHMPAKNGEKDLHLVKIKVHHKDGTIEPRVHYIEDFERPFWVTKRPYQNHKQKKEYEHISKVNTYRSTQSNLRRAVANALGMGWSNADLRMLSASPYLYGTDVSSTTIIKQMYAAKYPDINSPYTIATFDIETDMLHGTDDPIMSTTVFGKHIYCVIVKSFFDGYTDVIEKLRATAHKHIFDERLKNENTKPKEKDIFEVIRSRGYELTFELVDDPVELIRRSVNKAHEWKPDFLAIWNMDFDIPRILDTLKKYNVDAAEIFCDPSVPPERRFCEYKKGTNKLITASGQVKPKNPSEQWHSLLVPASFYVIDAMCSYRFIRQGAQEEVDYKLNTILDKILGIRKLDFDVADHITSQEEWHIFMQKNYPFAYTIYNVFDSLSMLEMEYKTNDLSASLPIQCVFTDFAKYNSQTRKIADQLYFYWLNDRDLVIGTVGPKDKGKSNEEAPDYEGFDDNDMERNTTESDSGDDEESDEEDENDPNKLTERNTVLSLRQWIVTLASQLSALGLPLIVEDAILKTLIRAFAYDSDAVSAYPSATAAANVSRATTIREIIDIIGVDESVYRLQNINLLQGHVNALEYSNRMFNLPTPQEMLELID